MCLNETHYLWWQWYLVFTVWNGHPLFKVCGEGFILGHRWSRRGDGAVLVCVDSILLRGVLWWKHSRTNRGTLISHHRVPLGSVTHVFSFIVNILPCFLLTKHIAAMEMQLKKTTVRARFTKEGKIACEHNPQMAVIGVVNFAVNLKRLRCFWTLAWFKCSPPYILRIIISGCKRHFKLCIVIVKLWFMDVA